MVTEKSDYINQNRIKQSNFTVKSSQLMTTVVLISVLCGPPQAAHLQGDHGDLAFAVAARGLPVLAGLLHVVTQILPQHLLFAIGAHTGKLLKLTDIF